MTAYIFIDTSGEARPRRVLAKGIDEAWRKYIADLLFPAGWRGNKSYEELREELARDTIVIMENELQQVP